MAIPVTGQVTPRYANDDGTYKKGQPFSYTDNGDGTITDNTTGLMWVKQPELIIPGSTGQIQRAQGDYADATAYLVGDLVKDGVAYYVCTKAHTSNGVALEDDWDNDLDFWISTDWTNSAANLTTPLAFTISGAISECEALVYAGHSDWRLPNVRELMSLCDFSKSHPAIDTAKFPNTKDASYWCSTAYKDVTTHGIGVSFTTGGVGSNANDAANTYVRPVRGDYYVPDLTNLVEGNIKDGVTIAGVEGEYTGEGAVLLSTRPLLYSNALSGRPAL